MACLTAEASGGGSQGFKVTRTQAPVTDDTGNRYGLHPVLKRLFHIKSSGCGTGDCDNGKCGTKHKGGGGAAAGGPPVYNNPAQGGTLVFPQHPYARSPRDWFEK